MKKEAKQSDVLLWTKVLHKLTIFSHLSPQKLGLLLILACCLLKSRTSCIYKARDKISNVIGILSPIGIDYQSFIKFFSTGKGDLIQKALFHTVLLFLFSTCPDCHLVLDCTNWEFGQVHKNILCVGAIYHGCFIPLIWIDLNKAGNSKLMSLLVLVYAMAIYEGVIIHQTEHIKTKTYKGKNSQGDRKITTYPEISVFRAGMNKIENMIQNLKDFIHYLQNTICTFYIHYQENIN